MRFVLILEASTVSPLVPQLTPEWLAQVAQATTVQLNRDVATYYGGDYGVRVGKGSDDVAKGEIVFAIVDALPDAPGAIAYHSVDGQAVPVAFLGLSTCKTLDDVSTAISHELCETAGDAPCNLWADDDHGDEYARELCDPVESWSYRINGIAVSAFVTPAFFVEDSAPPYFFCPDSPGLTLSGPFTLAPGGYMIERTASGDEHQVTARMNVIPADRWLQRKRHWSSRAYRRGARL